MGKLMPADAAWRKEDECRKARINDLMNGENGVSMTELIRKGGKSVL